MATLFLGKKVATHLVLSAPGQSICPPEYKQIKGKADKVLDKKGGFGFLGATLSFLLTLNTSIAFSQSLHSLAIEVKGASREFSFTNKESAFYYGETNADNTTSWQGFNVFGHEFLNDYAVYVYGKKLERSWITKTLVYPDRLTRIYKNGIVEELHIADSIAAFAVTIISERAAITVEIVPDFAASAQELVVRGSAVARASHLERTPDQNYPVWIAVGGDFSGFDTHVSGNDTATFPFVVRGSKRDTKHTFTFAVSDGPDEAEKLAGIYVQRFDEFNLRRRERMETLLRQTYVETDDRRFNKALAWAKLSLDALMMNQITRGIFAGLPWFNNYWGRDTFISLPGATLVTGRFAEAKEILRSFAAFQQSDPASTDYGRIPNIVTTTDKAYNTADGTPRFVMMAREYVVRSGDSSFIEEVYPMVRRSIDGTLRYHTDSLGFLTHGDAETWMDAVGPDGPWGPRGNRANDVQALWAQQLEAGIWFALKRNDPASARTWQETLESCKANFNSFFVAPNQALVYDHLRRDGTPDIRIRPNQIFTGHLLPDSVRTVVLKNVVSNLTYEYGVASLSQNDTDFHPYHQYEPYYPKDAAYHNGTVWTWVQGEVISELCRFGKQDLAARVTHNTVHQILDRGAVGTQSELLDAVARPKEKEPRLSGTFSQAWNLAQFIRNFYDDYLGVEVRRYEHVLLIRPRLPKSFGKVKARINLDGKSMMVEITPKATGTDVTIKSHDVTRSGMAVVTLPERSGQLIRTTFQLLPKSDMKFELRKTEVALTRNGSAHEFTRQILPSLDGGKALASLRLATPKLNPKLKALKGPDYPTIPHSVVKFTNPAARVLVNVADPAMDDTGTTRSRYLYPMTPQVVPGSFDIIWFTVTHDATNAYFTLRFRTLSNPGWHPEYGFQLTYTAIAIDMDGIPGSGKWLVPQNANFKLDERHGFERLILIGGGVQLRDTSGKILAAYIPTAPDVSNPLGNVHSATIAFAIPLSYLGKPDPAWTYTVLSGGQDDHGGAGIGEFRTVNKEAGEWNGGGRTISSEPNVYDVVVAPSR